MDQLQDIDAGSTLVVNVGGVTIQLSVVAADGRTLVDRLIDPWDGTDKTVLNDFLAEAPPFDQVGHRVVHSGGESALPSLIDARLESQIAAATPLAPLHQERVLSGIRAVRSLVPTLPHIACFDSHFHRTMPASASTYAIPAEWSHRWRLRRLGFHGFSHEHVASVAQHIAGRSVSRIVSCHLASGSSLCAIQDGRSVDTTMGLTPLEGLTMATRSGSVDPGLILWLVTNTELTASEVTDGLYNRSGLAGLGDGTGDMRDIVNRAGQSDERATLALEVFLHGLRKGIAAMAAVLGGVDALAFTGGVGEHMATVRAGAVEGLEFLGLELDPVANTTAYGQDTDVSGANSRAAAIVVATGEHVEIAAACRRWRSDSM